MNKTILALFLGAATASAWWAVATLHTTDPAKVGALYIPAMGLSVITLVVIILESDFDK